LEQINHIEAFDLARQYGQRIEVLGTVLPSPEETFVKNLSELTDHNWLEDEESINIPLPEPPPTQIFYKSFWLMRVLATTIQTGGHLTPRIYVPKSVWYQSGAKFTEINTKAASCFAINETLVRLKEINVAHKDLVTKELETFVIQLSHIQNSLSKALYYIPEYKEKEKLDKKEKRFGQAIKKMGVVVAKSVGMVKGRSKLDDLSSYLLSISDVLQNSQFLEQWLQFYLQSDPNSVVTRNLKRISDFFLVVICAFVVHDLNGLLERHMKKEKGTFTKLPSEKKAKRADRQ